MFYFIRTGNIFFKNETLISFHRYNSLNVVGCIAWVVSMLFAGHYLNKFFNTQFGFDLEKHLELIVLGIVIVTTAPVIIKLFFTKKKKVE